nr:hypothetical protein [Angustibacter aerolatus]
MTDTARGSGTTTNLNHATSGNGTLFTDADDVWGDGTTANAQSAAVDAAYGAQAHLGLLQEHPRPQRHLRRRPRRPFTRALRQQLRERLLGRHPDDLRRRREQRRPADRDRRRRPRDEPRRHRGHRRPGLHRRRRRPERGHQRHLRHRRRVQRQQRTGRRRLPDRREDRPQRQRHAAALHGQAQQGRLHARLLEHQHEEPRPALLVRGRQPLVLPGLGGLGRQDDQRRRLQQPDLQRVDRDRHRSGRRREDLVPRPDDVHDLHHHLHAGPRRLDPRGDGPLRRQQHPVHRRPDGVDGALRARRLVLLQRFWRRHRPDAAHHRQPARQPGLRVRRHEPGPVPPDPSPTTPVAPRAPAPGLWLGGNGSTSTENESQTVTVASTAAAPTLSFWLRTDTAESGSTAYDTMKVQVVSGGTTTTLATYSNVNANSTYTQKSFSLSAYKGKSVSVKFLMSEDSSLQTSFVVDDTSVTNG